MSPSSAGYQEIEHTADWELEVWAPDLEELFVQAAKGMMALSGLQMNTEPQIERQFDLQAPDNESLLVAFLSELLFLGEQEGLGFDHFRIKIHEHRLSAQLSGAPLLSIDKEIKAVTFHRLAILTDENGLRTRLVFDV
jgi:SHS2 domain-containing protein